LQLAWLKWLFVAISVGSVLLAGYFMLTAKHSIQQLMDVAAFQAGSRIDKPDIKTYDGDNLSWRLQAESAQEQGDEVLLSLPVIDVYTENRTLIPIQSATAIYHKNTGHILFEGDVKLHFQGWDISSEDLDLFQEAGELQIQGSFLLLQKGIKITGKMLKLTQETRRIQVLQGVHMDIEVGR